MEAKTTVGAFQEQYLPYESANCQDKPDNHTDASNYACAELTAH